MLGKMVARALTALALIAGGASIAAAQNYDGSGLLKFGVFGQGNFLEFDQSQPLIASASPSGFGGGVSFGYDLQSRGNWLVGLEVDGSFGDARDIAGSTDYGFDYLATARARFGLFPRPDWLIYGTAGVGFLGMEAQMPGIGNKSAQTLVGFVGGAGTEIDWHHLILFGEYLYGTFDDANFSIANIQHNASADMHIVRLGVKFKIGHDFAHDYDHAGHHKRYEPLK
jgi:opacity protein-like surface antigen